MSHTIYAAKFYQMIIHQHVHLRRKRQSHVPAHVLMRLYPMDSSLVFNSRLITGFVTRLKRRVSLVEKKLLTLPQHMSSHPVFNRVCISRFSVLYVCFVDRCFSLIVLFLLAIVLSVLLRYTDYDYPLVSFGHCVVCSS